MYPVTLNYLAIFVSTVAAFVVGALWYSPALFAKQWMKELGISPESVAAGKKKKQKEMMNVMVGMFFAELVMAYVFAHVISFSGANTLVAGLQGAFWMWLGFVAMPFLAIKMFEQKSWTYYYITVGHYLAVLLIMGAILVTWRY